MSVLITKQIEYAQICLVKSVNLVYLLLLCLKRNIEMGYNRQRQNVLFG